jgi:metal-responsive CopG/Arc/MetJ family transcriptional regulator
MANSTNIVKRNPGRPVEIGARKIIGLRLPEALLKRIDAWGKQKKINERSEAVRALIERGLEK